MSVTLPCALQERTELFGRLELLNAPFPLGRAALLFGTVLIPGRAPGCVANGGRLADSCDMRLALTPGCMFCEGRAATMLLFAETGRKLAEFIVRTGMCDAAGAGEVRATTLRF